MLRTFTTFTGGRAVTPGGTEESDPSLTKPAEHSAGGRVRVGGKTIIPALTRGKSPVLRGSPPSTGTVGTQFSNYDVATCWGIHTRAYEHPLMSST